MPETRVLMLTASTEANAVIDAVAAGAAGYLRKVADVDQVLDMMREAATGQGRLPTDVVRRAVDRMRSGVKTRDDVDLTPREKEILVSFCQGMTYTAMVVVDGGVGGHRPKRHRHDSGQAGRRLEAGGRGVGLAQRDAG